MVVYSSFMVPGKQHFCTWCTFCHIPGTHCCAIPVHILLWACFLLYTMVSYRGTSRVCTSARPPRYAFPVSGCNADGEMLDTPAVDFGIPDMRWSICRYFSKKMICSNCSLLDENRKIQNSRHFCALAKKQPEERQKRYPRQARISLVVPSDVVGGTWNMRMTRDKCVPGTCIVSCCPPE